MPQPMTGSSQLRSQFDFGDIAKTVNEGAINAVKGASEAAGDLNKAVAPL